MNKTGLYVQQPRDVGNSTRIIYVGKRMALKPVFFIEERDTVVSKLVWLECLTFKSFLTEARWQIHITNLEVHNACNLEGLYLWNHFCHTILIQINVLIDGLCPCGDTGVGVTGQEGGAEQNVRWHGKRREPGKRVPSVYSVSTGWAPQLPSNFLATN